MTEPVSQTGEARKFLFWTDKRPIAPDTETKITCAISEIGMAGVQVLCNLVFIGLLLQVQALDLEDHTVAPSVFGPLLMPLASIFFFLTGAHAGFPRSAFQSGVPTDQTRLSRILLVIAMAAFGGFMVSLSFWVLNLAERSDLYLAELAGLYTVCALASYGSSIIVRACWILELRAEQGHKLPLGNDEDETTASQPAWHQRATK